MYVRANSQAMKTHIESFEVPRRTQISVEIDGKIIGRVLYNEQPKHKPFKALGIPEIQDLFINPGFRRRGVATLLIKHCEDVAKKQSHKQIGISVALHKNAGAAQILYTKLGYVPDGLGVTYDRAPVDFAALKPVDDDLCIMLTKYLCIGDGAD